MARSEHKPVIINPAQDLRLVSNRKAETILMIHDNDEDIPQCSLPFIDDPDFRMWIIPLSNRAVMKVWIDDYIGDYEPMDKEDTIPTRREAREAIEEYESLGYVALVGNVITSMIIGSGGSSWGQGHGIGTQIIRWLQQEYAKSGLFALNVVDGRKMLENCGFSVLPQPPELSDEAYDGRPFMFWNMSDRAIAKTMKRYNLLEAV